MYVYYYICLGINNKGIILYCINYSIINNMKKLLHVKNLENEYAFRTYILHFREKKIDNHEIWK